MWENTTHAFNSSIQDSEINVEFAAMSYTMYKVGKLYFNKINSFGLQVESGYSVKIGYFQSKLSKWNNPDILFSFFHAIGLNFLV